MKKGKFVRLHIHSVHSTRDAMLSVNDIVDSAIKENEIPSITDHGSIGGVIEFINKCEKEKIKPIIGVEFYLNKDIKRVQEIRDLLLKEKDKNKIKKLQIEREEKKKYNHLILIARNTLGFYNLVKLNNKAYINGFYMKPTIGYDDLFSMDKDEQGDYGVIATSACLASPVGRHILNKDLNAATEWVKLMKSKFGKYFYLEVQANGIKEQKKYNNILIQLSKKYKIPLCVGLDAHYLQKDWADTHQDLLLLQNKQTREDLGKIDYRITWENSKGEEKTKKILNDKEFRKGVLSQDVKVGMTFGKGKNVETVLAVEEAKRGWEFSTNEIYYKSEKEIRKYILSQHKELAMEIENIISGNYKIYEQVEEIKLNKENKLPAIENAYEELVNKVKTELKKRKLVTPEYVERLKYELQIIKKYNFSNYFLILADFMQEARNRNIALGAGRGSGVSSLVGFLLGIHRINPLLERWGGNMNFDRFLNADRGNYPDVDVDVDGSKRDEMINYLIEKYGEDYVSYVGIRSEYSSKSAIRDLATVHGIPPSQSIECTKEYNAKMTVQENMKSKPKVKKYFEKYPDLIDRVDRLNGTISNLGIHAGGVVISDKKYPIKNFCALQRPVDEGERIATLWDKKEIEQVGFVKYDILGLSSCAQVHRAFEMLKMDPYQDAPDDEEVYRDIVLNKKNKNIFQFETFLGQRAFIDFMPTNFVEIANCSAILRVLGTAEGRAMYETYRENVAQLQQGNLNYWKEQLRDQIIGDENYEICVDVLKDSYGVLIFQEQLAALIHRFSKGKLSFGQGDIARRAMENHGKKFGMLDEYQGNPEGLKKWHDEFVPIIKQYVEPYIGADMNLPDVKAFMNFKLNADNFLITPKRGIISWFISSSSYLFNKLHAVAYTVNSYNMMWLKHFYPLQFWTASLQLEEGTLEKVRNFVSAIKVEQPEIQILPPDINKSELSFSCDPANNTIRYGLRAILGLGKSAELIIKEREENGDYKSVKDFLNRVPTKVNVQTIFRLICVNAFSDFGSQQKVWKEFNNLGKKIIDLPETSIEKANLENKFLGINITHRHPIMETAGLYIPLNEVGEGDNEVVALKILKKHVKQTKTGKTYNMFKAECLNCGMVINLFDWQNREVLDDYLIARISMRNNFYQLLGPSTYKPFSKAKKAAFKKALNW